MGEQLVRSGISFGGERNTVLAGAVLRKPTEKGGGGHIPASLGGEGGGGSRESAGTSGCAHSFLRDRLAEPLLGTRGLAKLGQDLSLVEDLCS